MTHTDFNNLLGRIKALTPEQVRQLRQQLDCHSVPPKKLPGAMPGTALRGSKSATTKKKPLTADEFNRRLLAAGRIASLPDPALDIDDDDPGDQPVPIEGEPLSETIIRERR